jgi:hypothetical protein
VQDLIEVVCAPLDVKMPEYDGKSAPKMDDNEEDAPSDWIKRLDIATEHDAAGKSFLSVKEPGGNLCMCVCVCVCVLDRILLSPLKSLRGSAITSTI